MKTGSNRVKAGRLALDAANATRLQLRETRRRANAAHLTATQTDEIAEAYMIADAAMHGIETTLRRATGRPTMPFPGRLGGAA